MRLVVLTKRTRAHGFGDVESHAENFVLAAAALGHEPLVGAVIAERWLREKLLPYEHPRVTDQPIDTCFTYGEIVRLVGAAGFALECVRGYRFLRYLEMLPGVRTLWAPVALLAARARPRVGGVRFAYNLLLRCRKTEAAP